MAWFCEVKIKHSLYSKLNDAFLFIKQSPLKWTQKANALQIQKCQGPTPYVALKNGKNCIFCPIDGLKNALFSLQELSSCSKFLWEIMNSSTSSSPKIQGTVISALVLKGSIIGMKDGMLHRPEGIHILMQKGCC